MRESDSPWDEPSFTPLTNFDEARGPAFHFPRFAEARTLAAPEPPGRLVATSGFGSRPEQHMLVLQRTIARRTRALLAAGVFALTTAGLATPARSDQLAPETKLRVNVIQWMPTKGVYERWDALGGEFVVSQSGAVVLPVIGSVSVGNLDSAGLATEIAKRLQEKLMLVDRPDTTVEILDYPPIYVVGTVATPGEYRFRAGMTVLQALALSGGQLRSTNDQPGDEIKLVGELQGMDTDIIRSMARIARLDAEMTGSKDISFPTVSANDDASREIFAQERIIFSARANELDRQTKSLAELRDLLTAEINVLMEKIKAADASIKSAEGELANVTTLVEKGIAVASRKSDLERALAGDRTDRLDQVTAAMRARQAITEATRNSDGLRDRQQTEVASSLQAEQASLADLKLKREVSQKLLLEMLGSRSTANQDNGSIAFTITRTRNGLPAEISASASTAVMPGDVISVAFGGPPPSSAEGPPTVTDTTSTTGVAREEASQ